MILYLDNSVLNRPFDDQKQARVWLETLAFSFVLQLVEAGQLTMVRSPIHDLENVQNPMPIRRQWVDKCLCLAQRTAPLSDAVRSRALELERAGVKPLDALHAAAAEIAGVTHFLTCDDRFLRRYTGSMSVLNPADFVLLWSEQKP